MQKLTRFILLAVIPACGFWAQAQSDALSRPMPERWEYSENAGQTLPGNDSWWQRFDDPVLDTLISMGEDANFNLIMAYRRMEAASRQMDAARAGYYPEISLGAGYTRQRQNGIASNRWQLGATASCAMAFVFGVLPMLFATGAGAASRVSLGTAVVFGMAVNALFGTLFVPNFWELLQRFGEKYVSPFFHKEKGLDKAEAEDSGV